MDIQISDRRTHMRASIQAFLIIVGIATPQIFETKLTR
jgi:hypothetical protein